MSLVFNAGRDGGAVCQYHKENTPWDIKKIKEMLCQGHQPGGFLPGVSFQAQQLLGAACF